MNLPARPEITALKLGFEWADPARALRQKQIFGRAGLFSVADVRAAQTDVTNVTGQRATALLAGLAAPKDPRVARALQTLQTWNHRSTRDSVGAALFNVWYHLHVRAAVVRRLAPAALAKTASNGDSDMIIGLLEKPEERFGTKAARDELLLAALSTAVAELGKKLGPDPTQWTWGQLHHAHFVHPLTKLQAENSGAKWDVGPISKGGDTETLNRSAWNEKTFKLENGASARFVAEVGNWNNVWATNSPGQSADPRSPHYRDLFEDWAHDRYFPLLYDRAAVEKETGQRILLVAKSLPDKG